MNSLLKRQIRKYLTDAQTTDKNLEQFLDAVDRSYNNFDEQFTMQQRAMGISSEELFHANQQLRQETEGQQEVIDKLKRVIETLKFYELPEYTNTDNLDLDELKLVDYIDNQTKEIIEINKQREKLLSELAHQNQELNDYAHMISHDLKSPLRSIYTLTTWLKDDYENSIDAKGKESLKLIRSNVEKMDLLINSILEYSTINKTETTFYNVSIDKLIDDIVNTSAVPNHISICKKQPLPIVKGDKHRLHQLFENLISNAIKYNHKEKGLIEIGFSEDDTFWNFYIKDNGKGIDKTYFQKIFKAFNKLENNPESTGMGLALVKKIIQVFGGTIWLESKLKEGTTFYFTLKKEPHGTGTT